MACRSIFVHPFYMNFSMSLHTYTHVLMLCVCLCVCVCMSTVTSFYLMPKFCYNFTKYVRAASECHHRRYPADISGIGYPIIIKPTVHWSNRCRVSYICDLVQCGNDISILIISVHPVTCLHYNIRSTASEARSGVLRSNAVGQSLQLIR